jgi:UDP-N-acetylenolpyruvoylglucosamine reductase
MNTKDFEKESENRWPEKLLHGVRLGKYTSYKIGGPADYFFEAREVSEIADMILIAQKYSIPYLIIGGGTNILISDTGVRGLVIKNSSSGVRIVGIRGKKVSGEVCPEEVFVESASGVLMNKVVRFTIEEGLSGLEYHLGLPGSVGGAVSMNAKWMKDRSYVGDVVYQGTVINEKGIVERWNRGDFHFGYGVSALSDSANILLSVVFRCIRSDKHELWEKADRSVSYRRETQPNGISAGCTFKNISESDAILFGLPDHTTSVGKLIDMCGLKGHTVGGAMISPVHGNFIVNTGGATGADVIELMTYIEEVIRKRFGITLVREVKCIGDFT